MSRCRRATPATPSRVRPPRSLAAGGEHRAPESDGRGRRRIPGPFDGKGFTQVIDGRLGIALGRGHPDCGLPSQDFAQARRGVLQIAEPPSLGGADRNAGRWISQGSQARAIIAFVHRTQRRIEEPRPVRAGPHATAAPDAQAGVDLDHPIPFLLPGRRASGKPPRTPGDHTACSSPEGTAAGRSWLQRAALIQLRHTPSGVWFSCWQAIMQALQLTQREGIDDHHILGHETSGLFRHGAPGYSFRIPPPFSLGPVPGPCTDQQVHSEPETPSVPRRSFSFSSRPLSTPLTWSSSSSALMSPISSRYLTMALARSGFKPGTVGQFLGRGRVHVQLPVTLALG